ncbi:endonuclease [Alphaproteobacteria bacterium GH1-50]|uniref:Endonuclease n=1 Tax=Kangsaoukella pontilimi TaxID=2691042 RepID=A0A7C9IJE0_9RHOB|nr:endonuclease/exonuclease/phosphatase family protein [Kangsaoukella pontilimi]MXQ08822.1 endonuclease [Kangsaoukella pontilimi]
MRLATYNVEWFTHLFDDDGKIRDDGGWSGRHDVRRRDQLDALGIVFSALDADGVMIIEAPDSHRRRDGIAALENFAARMELRARKAVMGFVNETQQEIAFLYDPDAMDARHDPKGAPRFDEAYKIDLDVDAAPEKVVWSKPPLELAIETATGPLRLIGVHAKSKAPHGAHGRDAIMRVAIDNRRKQLAQCIWLRERVDDHLDAGDEVIVMGDFNDGPGLDEYEKLFGRSGVEIVIGGEGETRLIDPHAQAIIDSPFGGGPTSARFWMDDQKRYMETLLDYIMVSPNLAGRAGDWRIWHPFDDPVCYRTPELQEALLTASDHFPVSIEVA